jgi:nuclear pore complex protein Nup155
VFLDSIKDALVISTPLEVIVMGIDFSVNSIGKKTLTLCPGDVKTPSDNVNMLSISSTRNGRVFMAGGDGSLYEFVYQSEDGWFNRKCRLVNHSSTISKFTPSFFNFMFTGGLSLALTRA